MGDQLEPDAEHERPQDEQDREQDLALGPVIRFTQPWRPPSATMADFAKMKMNAAEIAEAASRITKLFGKFWNQIVKIVTWGLGRGWRVATAGRI